LNAILFGSGLGDGNRHRHQNLPSSCSPCSTAIENARHDDDGGLSAAIAAPPWFGSERHVK
jgi:hypothetical protein